MEIVLDGCLITDRQALHDQLSSKLSFPDTYGRNLDALYDLLSSYPWSVHVTLIHQSAMIGNLGKYGEAFVKTVEEAAEVHPNVTFTIYSENIKNST